MGVAVPVNGTDWLLLSKVNLVEVYGGLSGSVLWIALVGILTIAAATIAAILMRQRQALNYVLSTQDAQAEKLRALQLLDTIANSSPEIIFAKDLDGNYTLFNRAACRFSGKSKEEVLGRDHSVYMPPEQTETLRDLHRRIITRDETFTEEQCFSTALGEKIFLGTVGPLHDADGQVIGTYGIVRDITEQKQQEQELVRSKNKLRELSAHREKVREDERAYIARELHDDLGQYLTALRMDANLIQMVYAQDNEELATRLSGMKDMIDHLITEIRSVITRLRPMTLDLGLVSAAEWLIADYQERTGTACRLEVADPELQLNNDQSTTIFRILQESLTNVARHARAKRVDIRIDISDSVLRLEVRDDGRGFDHREVRKKKTFGLMGIRERVLIHGGSAKIDSELGKGTVLRVTLPLAIGEVA
jgi:PAS domain S-box-containing protein